MRPNLIKIPKQTRHYRFKDLTVTIENVVEIEVRTSGYHRLKSEQGLHIVAPGWYGLDIIGPKNFTI